MNNTYFQEFVQAAWDLSIFLITEPKILHDYRLHEISGGFGETTSKVCSRFEFLRVDEILEDYIEDCKFIRREIMEFAGMPGFGDWLHLIFSVDEIFVVLQNFDRVDLKAKLRVGLDPPLDPKKCPEIMSFVKIVRSAAQVNNLLRKEGWRTPASFEQFTDYLPCPVCPRYEGIAKDGFGTAMCFKCYHQWEAPMKDKKSEVKWWVNLTSMKSCPKCHIGIMKNGGCQHMTCKECGHEFNWGTMEPWPDRR